MSAREDLPLEGGHARLIDSKSRWQSGRACAASLSALLGAPSTPTRTATRSLSGHKTTAALLR
ncbi:MAG TPA: hypothetical protein VEZ12_06045, partial [Herpetosiphonaceae bacterium]|nr:hypothetical protein [Herpetosiphonaceae bacterium]